MKVDIGKLKTKGFIKQKGKNLFCVRIRLVGGRLNVAELLKIKEVAEKYGKGYIHLTSRQGLEIPNIALKNLEKVEKELKEVGLKIGSSGPTIRTILACQGNICPHGLIKAYEVAKKIDERISQNEILPNKFKISVCGCKNACSKPQENDIGIMGVLKKRKKGYKVFVGGKIGKSPKFGIVLFEFIENLDELLDIVAKLVKFFKENAKDKERFRDTIDRLGIETLKEYLKE